MFNKPKLITVVSGLPRSGTSMMMKMLEAGGLPLLVDNLRIGDDDNPAGYYEFEPVKKLSQGDSEWLADAQGKVLKVIAALITHLPATYSYQIIFMRRDMSEILASQKKMLLNRGEDPNKISDAEMAQLFEKHLFKVLSWIDQQPNMRKIEVSYNMLFKDPKPNIAQINRFLGNILDGEKMLEVINPDLYRQRNRPYPATTKAAAK
jgi:sulfotransferase family protein